MPSDAGSYDALIRKLDLRVRQIMQPNPVTIPADATVEDAAKAMERQSCSCLLVQDREKIVGIVTERDIVRRVAAKGHPPQERQGRIDHDGPDNSRESGGDGRGRPLHHGYQQDKTPAGL